MEVNDSAIRPTEIQRTFDSISKDLDRSHNFSPDGRFLVFDCRPGEHDIAHNSKLGILDLSTNKVRIVYEQNPPYLGVAAASFLNSSEIIALHSLTDGIPYSMTNRAGRIISINDPSKSRWLDSRDLIDPYTPGALRGGTHRHDPDSTGQWIGFTYNDEIMRYAGVDLRNVGVAKRKHVVAVPRSSAKGQLLGESFSVLLTTSTPEPKPGSDEYQRADGDCWVGTNGYKSKSGHSQLARAFRGLVAVKQDGQIACHYDVFVVDIPQDITVPGPLGPLQGSREGFPKPPLGAVVRRITRTASNTEIGLRGVTGFLKSTPDGEWIIYIGKIRNGNFVEDQLFGVSTRTGISHQISRIPGGISGDPAVSQNGGYVIIPTEDGAVWAVSIDKGNMGHAVVLTHKNPHIASRIDISPDSKLAAFNRTIDGVFQIFTVELPGGESSAQHRAEDRK